MTASYPNVQVANYDEKVHRRQLAEASNRHNSAKFNCSLLVTLNANATTTTMTDSRITAGSVLCFTPQTAHAAGALSGLYVPSQQTGTATLTHANTADIDKTFNVGIFG